MADLDALALALPQVKRIPQLKRLQEKADGE
jgi:hypothetical protein